MIPKFIHQMGPIDIDKWHPLWVKCQKSWIDNFKQFNYKFWNDHDLDNLVKNDYSEYYDMYSELPSHIMKIDFARFCILHKFGGIYADLDIFCYKNFYNELKDGPHLIENPLGNDTFENSLMCSRINERFFLECMRKSKKRYYFVKKHYPELLKITKKINDKTFNNFTRPYLVFYISGTNLVSTVAREFKDKLFVLPGCVYNNYANSYDPEFRTKHMHTGIWGNDNINTVIDFLQNYKKMKKIDLDNFNFYFDYTNGNYLKDCEVDLFKNDVEPKDNTIANLTYI